MAIHECRICKQLAHDDLNGEWYCKTHYDQERQKLTDQGKAGSEKEHVAQDCDAEVADGESIEFLNPEPFIECEGYGDKQGKCPHEARKKAHYENSDDATVHRLCPLCYGEYRAERDQGTLDQSDDQ